MFLGGGAFRVVSCVFFLFIFFTLLIHLFFLFRFFKPKPEMNPRGMGNKKAGLVHLLAGFISSSKNYSEVFPRSFT